MDILNKAQSLIAQWQGTPVQPTGRVHVSKRKTKSGEGRKYLRRASVKAITGKDYWASFRSAVVRTHSTNLINDPRDDCYLHSFQRASRELLRMQKGDPS